MNDERRYSEAELHAIFERAAKRQEEAQRAEMASRGQLTLAELQEIGAASGIDPAFVAAAAREMGSPSPQKKHLLGFPAEIRHTRFIPHAVSDEAWERMVSELRRTFDQPGMAGEVGRVREWTTQVRRRAGAAVHVMLEPEDGGTRVTIEQTLRGASLGFVITGAIYAAVALLFGMLLATGVFDSGEALIPILFTAMAVLMLGGSRLGFGLYANRQGTRFEHALDRLELVARDHTPEQATEPSGQLDLDALPDEAEDTPPSERTRTRS